MTKKTISKKAQDAAFEPTKVMLLTSTIAMLALVLFASLAMS
ncbi:MAG: hypothetical protein ACM3MA_00340 [Acidobacteriota bacterium]